MQSQFIELPQNGEDDSEMYLIFNSKNNSNSSWGNIDVDYITTSDDENNETDSMENDNVNAKDADKAKNNGEEENKNSKKNFDNRDLGEHIDKILERRPKDFYKVGDYYISNYCRTSYPCQHTVMNKNLKLFKRSMYGSEIYERLSIEGLSDKHFDIYKCFRK